LIQPNFSASSGQATFISGSVWGFLTVLIRDTAYAYRLRALTNQELSWWKCFEIVFIWEFSSAVSPSALGGSAVAFFILSRRKTVGSAYRNHCHVYHRAGCLVHARATLPILFATFGYVILRPDASSFADVAEWGYLAIGLYLFMIVYASIFAYGVFIGPQKMKRLLGWLTNNRLLSRFHEGALKLGEDLIILPEACGSKVGGYT